MEVPEDLKCPLTGEIIRNAVKLCRKSVPTIVKDIKEEDPEKIFMLKDQNFERMAIDYVLGLPADDKWRAKATELGLVDGFSLDHNSEYVPALARLLSSSENQTAEICTWRVNCIVKLNRIEDSNVWRAEWRCKSGLSIPIAVKRLPFSVQSDANPDSWERLLMQLRVASRESDYLCKILGVFRDGDDLWIAMELLSHNLQHLIAISGTPALPVVDACRHGADIFAGLAVLHGAKLQCGGLAPRSVLWDARRRRCVLQALAAAGSPPNVAITKTPNGTENNAHPPSIVVALPAGTNLSRRRGYDAYLAPEALDTEAGAGAAGDVWSAGCIVAEMLRGAAPWAGLTAPQIRRMVRPRRGATEGERVERKVGEAQG